MSPRLRRAAAVLLALPVLGASLAACSDDPAGGGGDQAQTPAGLPAPMPDLELPLLGAEGTGNLADVERPTLVNVWATWCGPCREEMPLLQEFSEKYAGVVDVRGVNFQDPQVDAAKKFVAETGVGYPSLRDADGEVDGLAPFPKLRGLPFMAVVDGDGEMVGFEFSVAKSVADLEELVEKHLPGALTGDEPSGQQGDAQGDDGAGAA